MQAIEHVSSNNMIKRKEKWKSISEEMDRSYTVAILILREGQRKMTKPCNHGHENNPFTTALESIQLFRINIAS